MKNYLFAFAVSLISIKSISQNTTPTKSRFYLSSSYGLAGSFFVRSYDENPFPNSSFRYFYKKRFIGVAQNFGAGVQLKNNWEIQTGINFQHFTRHITTVETISGATLHIDKDIHHRDHMWYGNVRKNYSKTNNVFAWGFGLFYSRPKQEEIEIYQQGVINLTERTFKNSRLNEAGAFAELAYEYKFQPKVNLGIKTQFYYTITAGYPESVTLFPYIKILF
ncbi:MAG: hypothetical protein EOO06_19380 [Chitinophagaceae bacterium]|nr:MAG: hypothetical protein EOO06_19380 [Chitinophagaceae bacterium]